MAPEVWTKAGGAEAHPRVLPAALLTEPAHLQLKRLAILLVHLVQPVNAAATTAAATGSVLHKSSVRVSSGCL